MRPAALKYESLVQFIYASDIWTYHMMTYLVYDRKAWDNLPSFTWTTPFWYVAALSMIMWACMVLYSASIGTITKIRSPGNVEMVLWFIACLCIHPIFFYSLAFYSNNIKKWYCFLAIVVYRLWAARQMIHFLQEVREKMIFLQARVAEKRQN